MANYKTIVRREVLLDGLSCDYMGEFFLALRTLYGKHSDEWVFDIYDVWVDETRVVYGEFYLFE